ncbi:MBL fold metallo-hydrolase [Streptomyces sp. NBC_01618]|uniref:MBL fold metallo-hydrolase n=1 Tax=Streptomyces sp. NBC_01618 TaxID=2975900 RepID=UPI00386FA929|nr:MBL fold metallo-hydrolase [Streptomyces sp. NBC_01618]
MSRRGFLAGAAATGLSAATLSPTPAAAATSDAEAAELTRTAQRHRTRLALLGTVGGPTWYGDHSDHGICSALLVGDQAYLVDFGSGAYRQLRHAGVAPGQERALFITHLHSDHVIDLASLLMYDPGARHKAASTLHIVGPGRRGPLPPLPPGLPEPPLENPDNPGAGTADMVNSLFAAHAADLNVRIRSEGGADVRRHIRAHDIALPPGHDADPNKTTAPDMDPFVVWEDENVRVSATLVPHGLVFPNLAYRIDTEDGSVAFSGDTAVSENLIRLARGVDILVHEVIDMEWIREVVGPQPWNPSQQALYDHIVGGHTQIQEVGPVAERAGAKTLVLSHLVPGGLPNSHWQEAAKGFSGRTIVGRDMTQIGVGRRSA